MRWWLWAWVYLGACGDNRLTPDARTQDAPADVAAGCPASCDDGDPCTSDSCVSGVCVHVNTSACGTAWCALPTGTCTSWKDSDHDGLSDAWETNGYIDVNCNGIDDGPTIDVPLPGANPLVPDIYVRYDYMVKSGAGAHDHAPPPAALAQVVAAFAAHGVTLHFIAGLAIPEHLVVTLDPAPTVACAGTDFVTTAQLRQMYLGNLGRAYHYLVFGHRVTCPDLTHCSACPAGPLPAIPAASGAADLPGDDFVVTFGYFVDMSLTVGIETFAAAIMHELGHNLGLHHGGDDDTNHKPNYVSVMNYSYETNGITVADVPGSTAFLPCTSDADCGPPARTVGRCATMNACHCTDDLAPLIGTEICYRVDYSDAMLPSLDEAVQSPGVGGLDENAGVAGGASDTDILFYFASGGSLLNGASNGAPIDWNNDGSLASHVQADLNNDGGYTLLTGYNDWSHVTLPYQCTAAARP